MKSPSGSTALADDGLRERLHLDGDRDVIVVTVLGGIGEPGDHTIGEHLLIDLFGRQRPGQGLLAYSPSPLAPLE